MTDKTAKELIEDIAEKVKKNPPVMPDGDFTTDWYRNYSCHIRDDRAEIMAIESLIASMQNVHNISRNKAILKAFMVGIAALKKDIMYDCESVRTDFALRDLTREVKMLTARKRLFRDAYNVLGPTVIQELAEAKGVDFDGLLDEYRMPLAAPSPFSGMKQWITEYLEDKEPHKINDIRDAAIEAHILPAKDDQGFDRELISFKTAASNLGVSGGRRGWWQAA